MFLKWRFWESESCLMCFLLRSEHMPQYFWCRLTPLASVVVLFWWPVLFVVCVFWAGGPVESLWQEMVSQRGGFYFIARTWTWCWYSESNATVAYCMVTPITDHQRITVCDQREVLLHWSIEYLEYRVTVQYKMNVESSSDCLIIEELDTNVWVHIKIPDV